MRMPGLASASTVGSKNHPPSACGLPPSVMRAPLARASSTRATVASKAAWWMSCPSSSCAANALPTFSCPTAWLYCATKRSYSGAATRMRLAVQQSCPEVWNLAPSAMPTGFERQLLDARRRHRARNESADPRRAGEAHGAHPGVAHQCLQRHLRLAEHHVEHARGKAGLLRKLCQRECGKWRLLRRLDDGRAAHGDGGGGLARDHRHRE